MVPNSFGKVRGYLLSLVAQIAVSPVRSILTPEGRYVGSIFFHRSFERSRKGRLNSCIMYKALRQKESEEIALSIFLIALSCTFWPSFVRLELLTTQAARNLITGSRPTLPLRSVFTKLWRLPMYFLWYSYKFEHYLSKEFWVLAPLSSLSVLSAVFLNLSSLLWEVELGRNETEKKGPRTDWVSSKSPVQDPIPFSKFIPFGPGIHAIPFYLLPMKSSFISSESLRMLLRMSILPAVWVSNMVNSRWFTKTSLIAVNMNR